MEYSIQEVAKAAHTTSRTLRHYDDIGLLPPSRVGLNGYRYYDDRALLRQQRVLLLRDLGLALEEIRQVVDSQDAALRAHDTKDAEMLMSEQIFEGFDHTYYQEEVERRWGAEAYATGDRWWRGLGEEAQCEWQQRVVALNTDWVAMCERGEDPASPAAQDLAARHVAWLASVPGVPGQGKGADFARYVRGLAEMYVADERFAVNYGGVTGAKFVRDALHAYLG